MATYHEVTLVDLQKQIEDQDYRKKSFAKHVTTVVHATDQTVEDELNLSKQKSANEVVNQINKADISELQFQAKMNDLANECEQCIRRPKFVEGAEK